MSTGPVTNAAVGKRVVMMAVLIPDKRIELERKYGSWAVKTAISVCPHNDIKCIERESKRLYESRVMRREKHG
jgi:hypothetical protein